MNSLEQQKMSTAISLVNTKYTGFNDSHRDAMKQSFSVIETVKEQTSCGKTGCITVKKTPDLRELFEFPATIFEIRYYFNNFFSRKDGPKIVMISIGESWDKGMDDHFRIYTC
jgi:hypothetical protein